MERWRDGVCRRDTESVKKVLFIIWLKASGTIPESLETPDSRSVPALSARTKQGANRMTGLEPAIPLSADRLSPPGRRRAVPDPAHAAPDLRPGRHRGHLARCPKNALPEPDPAVIRPRNAPESALVLQRTTQVPNEATFRAARATAATAQV